jgi:hypothetical protein
MPEAFFDQHLLSFFLLIEVDPHSSRAETEYFQIFFVFAPRSKKIEVLDV